MIRARRGLREAPQRDVGEHLAVRRNLSRNKELIYEYERDKALDGPSKATLPKNLTRRKVMTEHLESQPLDEMDKADVKGLVA